MTAPTALRRKALAALREGRVTVFYAVEDSELRLQRVVARVRSSRKDTEVRHIVDGIGLNWHCTCQPVFAPDCGHIVAVQMVTGYGASA